MPPPLLLEDGVVIPSVDCPPKAPLCDDPNADGAGVAPKAPVEGAPNGPPPKKPPEVEEGCGCDENPGLAPKGV